MNRALSYILVGGASALAGAVAGYFICKKRLQSIIEEEIADRVNEELKKVRGAKENVCDNTSSGDISKEDLDKALMVIREEFGEDVNDYRAHILAKTLCECEKEGLNEEETDAKINNLVNGFLNEDDPGGEPDDDEECFDEDDVDQENPQFVMEEYANQPPHVIPLSDYKNLPPYFEFLTFTYFEHDDVLLDDKDMIVDDVDGTVGDALIHFDEEEEDGDCVYVLNGQLGEAIEIVRMHSSYAKFNGF